MSSREKKKNKLGTESIGKLLWDLSMPATIGMILNSMYNIVDTIFIGHGVGTLAIGGLAISFPIQMAMMAIALMIGQGAGSIVSRALGKKDFETADIAAANSFVIVALIGLCFSFFGTLFIEPLIYAFGATKEIFPYAKEYLSIILTGSVFFTCTISANNIIRAEGRALIATLTMIISTVLNIILDPLFIFTFNLGVRGAALATVISMITAFIFVLLYFLSGKSTFEFKFHHFLLRRKIVQETILIGLGPFTRQIGISFIIILTNNTLRFYGGNLAISSYGIIIRIVSFLMMPLFGIVQGFMPIAGYNYGANNFKRVKKVLRLALKSTTTVGILFFLLVQFFPKSFNNIFSTDQELIALGSFALRFVMGAFVFVGIQMVGAAFFQAIGKAGPALLLTMSRQFFFLPPLVILLPKIFGLSGVWASFAIADILSTAVTILFLTKELRHIRKIAAA